MQDLYRVDVLIGNIASGKTTYCKKYPNACIISKDDVRASIVPGTYVFDRRIEPYVHACCEDKFKAAVMAGCTHIIIDETNMHSRERSWVFRALRSDSMYTVRAIVFPDRGKEMHASARYANNYGDVSYLKWEEVYTEKQSQYEAPTTLEGFNTIEYQ